jgi:hypothetical protein
MHHYLPRTCCSPCQPGNDLRGVPQRKRLRSHAHGDRSPQRTVIIRLCQQGAQALACCLNALHHPQCRSDPHDHASTHTFQTTCSTHGSGRTILVGTSQSAQMVASTSVGKSSSVCACEAREVMCGFAMLSGRHTAQTL